MKLKKKKKKNIGNLISGNVVTRFAPSPTGLLHIGGLRTAALAHRLAKINNGKFLLRIEDTDRKRLVPGASKSFINELEHYGIVPDGKVVYQSDRLGKYLDISSLMIAQDYAYQCFMKPEELALARDGNISKASEMIHSDLRGQVSLEEVEQCVKGGLLTGRFWRPWPGNHFINLPYRNGVKPVIRFMTEYSGKTEYMDGFGRVVVNNSQLSDVVILKGDGWPTYHLAAAFDDYTSGVTHVTRGSEWIPSTAVHVQIHKAIRNVYPVTVPGLDTEVPRFIHMGVILNPSGKGKLSKRHASTTGFGVFARDYMSYNPDAVIDWLLDQFIVDGFNTEKMNSRPFHINFSKLPKINRAVTQKKSLDRTVDVLYNLCEEELGKHGVSGEGVDSFYEFMTTRFTKPSDVSKYLEFVNTDGDQKLKCIAVSKLSAECIVRSYRDDYDLFEMIDDIAMMDSDRSSVTKGVILNDIRLIISSRNRISLDIQTMCSVFGDKWVVERIMSNLKDIGR